MLLIEDDSFSVDFAKGNNKIGKLTSTMTLKYLRPDAKVGYFESVNDFLRILKTKCPTPSRTGSSSQKKDRTLKFNTFETYEKAMKTFLYEPGSLANFQPNESDVLTPTETGREVEWAVTGDFLDIGRYLEGEPEHFGHMQVENPRGLRVNIILDLVCVWDVDETVINHKMQQTGRLVDWLESNNVRTSIYGVISNQCGHIEVVLKNYEERFDINNVIVGSQADFFRRAGFRFFEYSDTWMSGYGLGIAFLNHFKNQKDILGDPIGKELNIIVYNNFQNIMEVEAQFKKIEDLIIDIAENNAPVPDEYVHVHGKNRW